MTSTIERLIKRVASLPTDERDAVSEDVLGYVDELVALRRQFTSRSPRRM
jgi:hypothetical protein